MEQHYGNHRRLVPVHHYFNGTLLLIITIGAGRNLFLSMGEDDRSLYNASLIMLLVVIVWLVWFYARAFALRAQDRVIMLEERLRHQQLAGRPLSAALRPSQIIALRFASDEEFVSLCEKAERENLSADQIKRSVQHWRADRYRV